MEKWRHCRSLISRLLRVLPRPHLEDVRTSEAETERMHQLGITIFRNSKSVRPVKPSGSISTLSVADWECKSNLSSSSLKRIFIEIREVPHGPLQSRVCPLDSIVNTFLIVSKSPLWPKEAEGRLDCASMPPCLCLASLGVSQE